MWVVVEWSCRWVSVAGGEAVVFAPSPNLDIVHIFCIHPVSSSLNYTIQCLADTLDPSLTDKEDQWRGKDGCRHFTHYGTLMLSLLLLSGHAASPGSLLVCVYVCLRGGGLLPLAAEGVVLRSCCAALSFMECSDRQPRQEALAPPSYPFCYLISLSRPKLHNYLRGREWQNREREKNRGRHVDWLRTVDVDELSSQMVPSLREVFPKTIV